LQQKSNDFHKKKFYYNGASIITSMMRCSIISLRLDYFSVADWKYAAVHIATYSAEPNYIEHLTIPAQCQLWN